MKILINLFDYSFYEERISTIDINLTISHLWYLKFFEEKIFINIINQIMAIDYWKLTKYGRKHYYTT